MQEKGCDASGYSGSVARLQSVGYKKDRSFWLRSLIISVRMSVLLIRFLADFLKVDIFSFVIVENFLFTFRIFLFLFSVLSATVALSSKRVVVLLLAWIHFPENSEKTADNLAHKNQYCNDQCKDKCQ